MREAEGEREREREVQADMVCQIPSRFSFLHPSRERSPFQFSGMQDRFGLYFT